MVGSFSTSATRLQFPVLFVFNCLLLLGIGTAALASYLLRRRRYSRKKSLDVVVCKECFKFARICHLVLLYFALKPLSPSAASTLNRPAEPRRTSSPGC